MTLKMLQGEESATNESMWLAKWQKTNFSWAGLAKHAAWPAGNTLSLQDFLRRIERGATDEDLAARGLLLDCGRKKLYHVLFIPDEWATRRKNPVCSPGELARMKEQYWNKLESDAGIADHFQGTISGAHLPSSVEQKLVGNTRASFRSVRFSSELRRIPKSGTRTFSHCLFKERLLIEGAATNQAPSSSLRFDVCLMQSDVELENVSNVHSLHFDTTTLNGFVTVTNSNLGKMRFDQCSLRGIRLTEAVLDGETAFFCCDVGSVEFASCKFSDQVLLLETVFQDSIDFLSCDFVGRVTFADVSWPPPDHLAASMAGSKFNSTVTIAANAPPPIQLFQDAEFASKVAFRGFSDRELRKALLIELNSNSAVEPQLVNPHRHAEHIESGCRTLRKVAEAAGDVHAEHFWHRAEIIARRRRGEVSISEKAFSSLYGLVADYGLSIARPFATLAMTIMAFALLYALVASKIWIGADVSWRDLHEGLGYSLNRTLPIGVFADDANPWRAQLLGKGGNITDIVVRSVATLQTIISAVLIFLGIMAVRRKFRIS